MRILIPDAPRTLPRTAFRMDTRGILSAWPKFGLADVGLASGALFIPDRPKALHGMQTTFGLTFYFV